VLPICGNQRSHRAKKLYTAKKSHSKEVTPQRGLTAKKPQRSLAARNHTKELAPQRSHPAKKPDRKEVTPQRSLTAKKFHFLRDVPHESALFASSTFTFWGCLARKLNLHHFSPEILTEVFHKS
jgi:hypothetical protein